MEEMEDLYQKNEVLKRRRDDIGKDSAPSQHVHIEAKSWGTKADSRKDEDEKKICYELCNLAYKYEEVVSGIGGFSSVYQLLNSTDLHYNERVMAMALPP